MSQIKKYKDIFEFFPLIEKNNMPDLTLICLENFILEYENVNDYLHYINNELNKLKETVFLKKKIYLCMVTKKNVDSSKVIDYYKVWRTVKEKYRIDSFILGYEMKLEIDDKIQWASCAEIDFEHLDIAIMIMYDYRYRSRSFLFITANDTLLLADNVINLFEMIVKPNISFDFISLYNLIQVKDTIINFSSDGEMIDLLIAQKQS